MGKALPAISPQPHYEGKGQEKSDNGLLAKRDGTLF